MSPGRSCLDFPFKARLEIANGGNTPAYDVHFQGYIRTYPIGAHPAFDYPPSTGPSGNIGPHQTYVKDLIGNNGARVNMATYKAFAERQIAVYVYGRIDYTDEFKKPHWVTYCSMLTKSDGSEVCDSGNATDRS